MIRVHVPATSANLGPGYDTVGLAFSWHGTFDFEIIDAGVKITGCDAAFCNEDNLVYVAFLKTLDVLQKKVPGISIHIACDLPLQRGLGSSAACIVAGALGANALFNNPLNKYEIFEICTQLEGHPDNIAPAIFGQLTVSFMSEGKPNMIRYGVNPKLKFLAVIPETSVSTKDARNILPTSLSYETAVKQLGMCAAFCKAMEIDNPMILHKACADEMHEPYRKQLIQEYDVLRSLCDEVGCIAMVISGSGSTMMIIDDDEDRLMLMIENIQRDLPKCQIRRLDVDKDGAKCEVL